MDVASWMATTQPVDTDSRTGSVRSSAEGRCSATVTGRSAKTGAGVAEAVGVGKVAVAVGEGLGVGLENGPHDASHAVSAAAITTSTTVAHTQNFATALAIPAPLSAESRSPVSTRASKARLVDVSDLPVPVSQTFDPARWRAIDGFPNGDITYHRAVDRAGRGAERDLPAVRIAFNRPEVRNAFRPQTVDDLYRALDHARQTPDVAAVIITGNGPSPKDGGWAFCSGGDQSVRGKDGYLYDASSAPTAAGRLHVLEVQRLMRTMPKVTIAAVSGWAAGGGHSLHVVADLSIASREHARFKQTDAVVGSFDAGYGSALLARQVGDKRAREIFFLAREYSADDAERWGAVNEVVDHDRLESTALEYAALVAAKSPQAIRMLKFAFNLADDGLAGQQVFAGEATRLAYMTDEAQEGRDAFLEKRDPDWSRFPYSY